MTELDPLQSKLLASLTLTAVEWLGAKTWMVEEDNGVRELRMARLGDIELVDYPARQCRAADHHCYLVEMEEAAAFGRDGKKFKIEPRRLPYSLQWLHNRTPPTSICS